LIFSNYSWLIGAYADMDMMNMTVIGIDKSFDSGHVHICVSQRPGTAQPAKFSSPTSFRQVAMERH